MFSAGEDLLADTNTQPTRESDSAECKEQHDACVREQFLEKQKTGDYVNLDSFEWVQLYAYTYFFKCEDPLFPLKRAESNEADGSQSGMILGIAEVLVTKPVLQI